MTARSPELSTQRPLRVLSLATQVKLGGHEASRRHAFELASAMQNVVGVRVTLIVNGVAGHRELVDDIDVRAVAFSSLLDDVSFSRKLTRSLLNNITAITKLRRVLDERPDAIYERHSVGSFLGIGLSIVMRRPLVLEVNGVPDEEIVVDLGVRSRFVSAALFHLVCAQLRFAQATIVQSEELREVLVRRFRLRRVEVVPNGVSAFHASALAECREVPRIAYIGTLDDIHNLSPVLEHIHRSRQPFEFFVIGDGRRLPVYREALSTDLRFRFPGRLGHVDAMTILASSDVAVAIYDNEYPLFRKYGFYLCPLKILEYLGHGVPCLFVGPTNRMIQRLARVGAIMPLRRPEDLPAAIDSLLSSPARREKMRQAAMLAAEEYTWLRSAGSTVDILQRVIAYPNHSTPVGWIRRGTENLLRQHKSDAQNSSARDREHRR